MAVSLGIWSQSFHRILVDILGILFTKHRGTLLAMLVEVGGLCVDLLGFADGGPKFDGRL